MVGLNVTRQVGVPAEDINRLLAGGKVAKVFGGLFAFFRESLQKIHGLSTASSSVVSTVDFGFLGPVGKSATEVRFFHFATVFWLIPWRFASALRLS